MELLLGILIVIVVVGFGATIYFFNQKTNDLAKRGQNDQSLVLLQNQISEITKTLDTKLGESSEVIRQQFGQSAQIIREVTERLTKLDETNRQVVNFTDQLQNLQDILKNPKQRGILGEYFLETVLQNVLPPKHFQMQYKFKDGEIVDAAVFLQDKILPIDSKFSLENYNRLTVERDPVMRAAIEKQFKQDLKMRIDETAKYIRPQENTMDFAFMFIPSEGIFYDLLINQVGDNVKLNARDLIDYAFKEKHVIIVSPTSFFAYLQTVLQGLRALKIEESAKEIRQRVEELGRHLVSYNVYLQKMGNNLNTTVSMYNQAYKEFKKIDKDIIRITDRVGDAIEPMQIDKVSADE